MHTSNLAVEFFIDSHYGYYFGWTVHIVVKHVKLFFCLIFHWQLCNILIVLYFWAKESLVTAIFCKHQSRYCAKLRKLHTTLLLASLFLLSCIQETLATGQRKPEKNVVGMFWCNEEGSLQTLGVVLDILCFAVRTLYKWEKCQAVEKRVQK